MTLVDFLVEWTLRSVVLLGLVAIPAFSWKRASASQRHALWFSALMGIVLLPFLTVLPNWRLPSAPDMSVASNPSIVSPAMAVGTVDAAEPEPLVPASRTRTWTWQEIVLWVWILGVVFQLTRWVLGQWRLMRWRAGAEPHPLEQHNGIAVVCHRDLPGPLVTGLFRPTILLPNASVGWESVRTKAVLAHEMAHLQRYDLWSHGLARLLLIAQWWNPILHLAVRQMEQASESACDDRVLGNGVSAADYSMMLLDVAREASLNRGFPREAVTMARTLPIEKRLKRLLDEKQSRTHTGTLGLVVALLAILSVATTIGTFTSQAQESEPDFQVKMRPLNAEQESVSLWQRLAAFPPNIEITSEGMGVSRTGEDSERVTFRDAKLSHNGFVVQAPEMDMVREKERITIIATPAELSGPKQMSGSCGLLRWEILSGNTESIQLRDGVVMQMKDAESAQARRIESKAPTAYIDIRFDEGEAPSFHAIGEMTVTLDKNAKPVHDDRERGFLGIIMTESAAKVDGKIVPAIQVRQVLANSGAFIAGVQPGDLIYSLNGAGFPAQADERGENPPILEVFKGQIASKTPGTVVTLDVLRGDKKMSFDVTLGSRVQPLS